MDISLAENMANYESLLATGYVGYRRDEVSDKNIAYRGTAVFVRRDIVHEELPLLPFRETRTVGVRTQVAGRETHIYAGYRPPLQTPMESADIREIFKHNVPTFLAADFNAKNTVWNSHSTNKAGKTLARTAEQLGATVLGPDSPTHVPTNVNHRADVLDVVMHRGIGVPMPIEVLYELSEPHMPILVTIASTATAVHRPIRRRIDWPQFLGDLEQMKVGPLSTPEEVKSPLLLNEQEKSCC